MTERDFQLQSYTPPNPDVVDFEVSGDQLTIGDSSNSISHNANVSADLGLSFLETLALSNGSVIHQTNLLDNGITLSSLLSDGTAIQQTVVSGDDISLTYGLDSAQVDHDSTLTSDLFSSNLWRIDSENSQMGFIGGNQSERVTGQELTLSFVVSREIRNRLRGLADHAGDVEIDDLAGGRFRATDMAGGDNTYEIKPPADRRNVSYTGDVLVEDYNETRLGNRGQQFRVTVTFVKRRTRDKTGGYLDETPRNDEWLWEWADGVVAKQRGIDAESIRENIGSTSELTVSLTLTPEEARIIREVPNRQAGDGIEEVGVSDGLDNWVDNTGQNMVTITAPPGGEDILPGGDYVVVDWSMEWTGGLYQTELTLGT